MADSPSASAPSPINALLNAPLSPHLDVVNLQTFFSLTERIGFRPEQTLSNYRVEDFIGIYSASFPSPLRRAFATVCRDVTTSGPGNNLQLFCQGQADLILSMCSDFWDGSDLHPFTPSIRARVKDFCNRSSQTGYCVALSYSPLTQSLRPLAANSCLRFVPKSDFSTISHSASASPVLASSATNLAPRWADLLEESNQIFIGVAVLSSHPLMPIIQLVQNLKNACSRFVYFSRESELMSRSFAEKLGLEANWNCFISLADSRESQSARSCSHDEGDIENCKRCSEDDYHNFGDDDNDEAKIRAPLLQQSQSVMHDHNHERGSPEMDIYEKKPKRQRNVSTASVPPLNPVKTSSSAPNLSQFCDVGEENSNELVIDDGKSPVPGGSNDEDGLSSHDSTVLDVIENRAQLPRGIKEVRPHLAQCDNVPLLVSLFTDCQQHSTNEMMSIMAENNNVVCSVGSCLVTGNFESFSSTHCAVSVMPLCPQAPSIIRDASTVNNGNAAGSFSAAMNATRQQQTRDIYLDMASRLISLPCSLTIRPNRICYLLQLMAQSRHYVLTIKQVFFYAVFAYATLVLAHLAHLMTDRPLPVSPLQFIWLTLIAVPALSMSMITAPVDENILTQPPHRTRVTSATVAATTSYFLATFLPAVPICLSLTIVFDYFMWYAFANTYVPLLCDQQHYNNTLVNQYDFNLKFSSKYQFIPPWWKVDGPVNVKGCKVNPDFALNFEVLSSELSSIFLGIYTLLLSCGFVFPLAPIWIKNPIKISPPFCVLLLTTIIGTVVIGLLHIFIGTASGIPSFDSVSPFSWILCVVTPIIIALPVHELYKVRRIKKIVRQLKRIRLEFNTRLGLNSPF